MRLAFGPNGAIRQSGTLYAPDTTDVAMKLTPVIFVATMVSFREAGVKVIPADVGVTVYGPAVRPAKEYVPSEADVVDAEAVPERVTVAPAMPAFPAMLLDIGIPTYELKSLVLGVGGHDKEGR